MGNTIFVEANIVNIFVKYPLHQISVRNKTYIHFFDYKSIMETYVAIARKAYEQWQLKQNFCRSFML